MYQQIWSINSHNKKVKQKKNDCYFLYTALLVIILILLVPIIDIAILIYDISFKTLLGTRVLDSL